MSKKKKKQPKKRRHAKAKKTSKPKGPPVLRVAIPLNEIDNFIQAFLTSSLPANVAVGYAKQFTDGRNKLLTVGDKK